MTHALQLVDMRQLTELRINLLEHPQLDLHEMVTGSSNLSRLSVSDTLLQLAPESLLQAVINTPSLTDVCILDFGDVDMQQVPVPVKHVIAQGYRVLELRGGNMTLG